MNMTKHAELRSKQRVITNDIIAIIVFDSKNP